MGYERYLSPNSDYSDFEIHRAQMRHYDDYMARVEDAGISGTFSTGFSYTGESTGRGGGHSSVAGPHVAQRVAFGGQLSEIGIADPEDLIAVRVGGHQFVPDFGFSNAQEFEDRYGDLMSAIYGIGVFAADMRETARTDAQVYADQVSQTLAPQFNAQERLEEQNQAYLEWRSGWGFEKSPSTYRAPTFSVHGASVGPDGTVYHTGGAF